MAIATHHIAANITRLRRAKGWRQADLAERTGLVPSQIHRLENGQEPLYSTLRVIADAFGITIDELSRPPKKR